MKGFAHVSCIKYQGLQNLAHYHSDYELVYVNRGRADVTIDEYSFSLEANQSAFIFSNDLHRIISDKDSVMTVLKIENKFFESVFASRALQDPIISDSSYIEGVLDTIRTELNVVADNHATMADCVATQLLITLFRKEKTTARNGQLFNRSNTHVLYNEICQKISNEYNSITFKAAAEYMHFSEPYFSKVFNNIFGMTFTQYLNTVRIAVAIEKLKENEMSITEIATSCGFNTIRNFNRVFKKFTGYSPNTLPSNYVFMYSLQNGRELDPTLNCTEILED